MRRGPAGIGITLSAVTRATSAYPPSKVSDRPLPVTSTASPGLIARIVGRFHDAREIDAADEWIAAQDSAGTGGRERVLVVDVGELHVDDDFAGRQRIECQVFESRGDLSRRFHGCGTP